MRNMVGLMWVALSLGVGCVGFEGNECQSDDECRSGLYCRGPNQDPACGIPVRTDCGDDSGCFNAVCHAVYDVCSPTGMGSACDFSCTEGRNCDGGFRCNETTGACEAVPCDEGFACPAHQVCDPSRFDAATPVFARHHGCFDVDCSSDTACNDGERCVNGRCQEGIGFCREVEIVP